MGETLPATTIETAPLKVLWLCSWFPHKRDPFDGDFVLRHAMAAAKYAKIHVIHVVQNLHYLRTPHENYTQSYHPQLTAGIYYPTFAPFRMPAFLRKIIFNLRYRQTLKKAINRYINENGLPHIVHVHVPVKAGWGARWILRKFKIPYVVTEHTSAYFPGMGEGYFHRGVYFRYNTRATFEKAALVSSVSVWLLTRLQHLFRMPNTMLIRNVVSPEQFYPGNKTTEVKKLLHVSMMQPLKNVRGILEALSIVKQVAQNWELVIIGPVDNQLREYASALGLQQHIVWKGLCAHETVAEEMHSAHALLHFSDYENLPCVVQEAICSGMYIISSNVGGIAELVTPELGILVAPRDISAFAQAIIRFLQQSLRPDISHAAVVAASFYPEKIGQEIVAMYTWVLKQKEVSS